MSLKSFFVIIIGLCFTLDGLATHIVGGELNYRCLGNDNYEISLTVFRDCYNGVPLFDNPASVGVFDSSNSLITNLQINFTSDDTLQTILTDSCLTIPTDICVHRTTYIDTVSLPFIAGGYQLAYQRCCRNVTIVNLFMPTSTGATFYTFISEAALLGCNSNSVFNQWPPVFICNGVPINFDHSATDADGDSLVYELCTPFRGAQVGNPQPNPPNPPPYDSVTWQSGYFAGNMLGGNAPLSIDAQTGLLTGTPVAVGQYVVGVCVKEYRNGVLISETKRDFQYNVLNCSSIYDASFSTPDVICDGFEVTFTRNNPFATDAFWDFGVAGTNSDTSILNNPTFTFPDTGTYIVTLSSGGNHPCADTFSKAISIYGNAISWDVMIDYNACEDSTVLHFADISVDNSGSNLVSWEWEISTNNTTVLDSQQSSSTSLYGNASNIYALRMFVENDAGCRVGGIKIIELHPIDIVLTGDSVDCRGELAQLQVTNLDALDTLQYSWSPHQSFVSYQPDTAPTVSPLSTTTYYLTATNPAHQCSIIDSTQVVVAGNAPPLVATADPDSVFLGNSSQLYATFDPSYSYTWYPPATLDDSSFYAPVATPYETTTYVVEVIDTNGCINYDSVTVSLRSFECEEPYIFVPNAFTPNNDGKNDILYARANVVDEFFFAIYNRWGQQIFVTEDKMQGWDGTVNGQQLPPDVFGYILKIKCLNGATYFKKGNVTLLR